MTDAEAPATQQQSRKTQDKRFPSPLALYKMKFCRVCADREYCNANTQHRLLCVLCAMLDSQLRINQLNQYRGAHL